MYLPLLWVGFKLRQHEGWGLRRIPWWLWIASDLLLFALWRYLGRGDGSLFRLLQMGVEFVLHIVGALMAFFVLQRLASHISWKQSRVFAMMSKCSMPIYLLHQQLVYILIVCFNGVLNPYLHAGVNFVGAMLISLLLSFLLLKFKWTRVLIGEKWFEYIRNPKKTGDRTCLLSKM